MSEKFQHESSIHGPAIPGVELIVGDEHILSMMNDVRIPGHPDVRGQMIKLGTTPDHGTMARVSWQEKLNGKIYEGLNDFRLKELVWFNEREQRKELGEQALSGNTPELPKNSQESRRERLLRKLFEPKTPKEKEPDLDFSNLLGEGNPVGDLRQARVDVRRQEIRPEDQRKAEGTLRSIIANPDVRGIFEKFNPQKLFADADLVKLARQSQGLRFELGTYFLNTIDSLAANPNVNYRLPPRLVDPDGEKIPNYRGFEWLEGDKLTSHEYAAYLMLSMIDGSFNYDDSKETKSLNPEDSQHRSGAEATLKYISDISKTDNR